MKKARFVVSDRGRCLTLTTPEGLVRRFFIPTTSSGVAYIREDSYSGPQVCSWLLNTGSTLSASPDTLLDVIRREWRRRRRNPDLRRIDEWRC